MRAARRPRRAPHGRLATLLRARGRPPAARLGASGKLLVESHGIYAADAGLVISPTPYNFGDAILGTPSAPQTFTVRNTGDAESGMITISLSGLDATQFELGTDACTGETLAADATCTVEVIYAPSASGVHMGTLQASASPGATATATIQGRAAAAASRP
jgi:hypothetical protein